MDINVSDSLTVGEMLCDPTFPLTPILDDFNRSDGEVDYIWDYSYYASIFNQKLTHDGTPVVTALVGKHTNLSGNIEFHVDISGSMDYSSEVQINYGNTEETDYYLDVVFGRKSFALGGTYYIYIDQYIDYSEYTIINNITVEENVEGFGFRIVGNNVYLYKKYNNEWIFISSGELLDSIVVNPTIELAILNTAKDKYIDNFGGGTVQGQGVAIQPLVDIQPGTSQAIGVRIH